MTYKIIQSKHVIGVGRNEPKTNSTAKSKYSYPISQQTDDKPNFGSQGKRKIKVSLASV